MSTASNSLATDESLDSCDDDIESWEKGYFFSRIRDLSEISGSSVSRSS